MKPPLKNQAEALSLEGITRRYNVFLGGVPRAMKEVFSRLNLPKQRKNREQKPIPSKVLFWHNKGTAFELLTAAWLSVLDTSTAKANCLADKDGNPISYAGANQPDVEVRFGDLQVIAEVSTLRASKGKKYYQRNLESALKHLGSCASPSYCLHITSEDPSNVRDLLLEKRQELEKKQKYLIDLSISVVISCLWKFEKNITQKLSAQNMQEWIKEIYVAQKNRLSLEETTEQFIEKLNKAQPSLNLAKSDPPQDEYESPEPGM